MESESPSRRPLFRDRQSALFWLLALVWFGIWAERAFVMGRMALEDGQGGAWIHCGLFAGSALLPIVLLATRDRPDDRRHDQLASRRSRRLAGRTGR